MQRSARTQGGGGTGGLMYTPVYGEGFDGGISWGICIAGEVDDSHRNESHSISVCAWWLPGLNQRNPDHPSASSWLHFGMHPGAHGRVCWSCAKCQHVLARNPQHAPIFYDAARGGWNAAGALFNICASMQSYCSFMVPRGTMQFM